jgi:hypothetical protein
MMRNVVGFALVGALLFSPVLTFGQAVRPILLVDSPTTSLLPRGSFALALRAQPGGSVLLGLGVELFDQLLMGVSYGGDQIIGYGKPNFNPRVEFLGKYRILEELGPAPSVCVGFDSQGYAGYFKDQSRYRIKSKGFYGVAGKTLPVLEGLHAQGGVNYSLETDDGENEPNIFMGVEQVISPELSIRSEFDLALNDNQKGDGFGEGRGYLNVGVRWTYQERMFFELDFCNLTGNGDPNVWRTIKIGYIEFL